MVASIKGVSPSVTGSVSGGLGNWPTNGSLTPQMPGGAGAPAAGDLLVMPVYVRITTATITDLTSAGWTRLTTAGFTSSANTAELWAKIAAGSDTAPALTTSPTSQPTGAIIVVVAGWSGDLADLVATIAGSTGANVTCPDASAPEDDCLVLRFGLQQDDNQSATSPTAVPPPWVPWDTPAGHTAAFYEATMAGSDASMAAAYEEVDTGAAGSAAFATNGADAAIGITLVIPPGGAVPAVGTVSAGIALDIAATGASSRAGAVSAPLALDISVSGARASAATVSAPISLDCEVSGSRESLGAVAAGLGLDIQVSGGRPAAGSVLVGLVLDIEVQGSNGQSGRPVQPYPWTPGAVSGYPWTPRPVKSFQEVPEP